MSGVLVTGATTPVGRALVRALTEGKSPGDVLAVGIEPRLGELFDKRRVSYVAIDLTRARNVRSLLFGPAQKLGIETIVHTALHRDPRDRGKKVHELNVELTRQLLKLAERHPSIRRFVYRSYGEVYRLDQDQPSFVDEEHPLELSPRAPQWVRDRVEADLTVCARMGMSRTQIAVLRCAEILAPECGSQLWDYLQSRVCLRPLGFDPMINLLTIDDAVHALGLAVRSEAQGIFNIPGADTLPLSRLVAKWGRRGIAVPGPLLSPLYALRTRTIGTSFRYDINVRRFHFNGVLDGTRAREILSYRPSVPVAWPVRD